MARWRGRTLGRRELPRKPHATSKCLPRPPPPGRARPAPTADSGKAAARQLARPPDRSWSRSKSCAAAGAGAGDSAFSTCAEPGSSFCWGPVLQGSTSPSSSRSSTLGQADRARREVRHPPTPPPPPCARRSRAPSRPLHRPRVTWHTSLALHSPPFLPPCAQELSSTPVDLWSGARSGPMLRAASSASSTHSWRARRRALRMGRGQAQKLSASCNCCAPISLARSRRRRPRSAVASACRA